MELVSNYQNFLDKIRRKFGGKNRVVCLLFVDPSNDDTMSRYIADRFEYLHYRTGKYVDFYCPGYSLNKYERIFSVKDFVDFTRQFEDLTSWRYYGGTNMLLIRYSEFELQFDSVYDLNFTRMIIDGLIKDHRMFIEDIIYEFRHIEEHMDKLLAEKQLASLWENLSNFLPEYFRGIIRQISDTKKINKYFTPHDIRKKQNS